MENCTVITSSRVLINGSLEPAAVYINAGKITKITTNDKIPDSVNLLDFADDVICPGLVDSHVHVNEPGRTHWEGFQTATQAAAAGGVTTIIDMPLNSDPVTTTLEALEQKISSTRHKLWVDTGLLGGIVPGNTKDITDMVKAGVCGFKCFMVFSGIDDFPAVTEKDIRDALSVLRDLQREGHKVLYMFHAEVPGPIDNVAEHVEKELPTKYSTFLQSRPKEAENEAIKTVIRLCSEFKEVRCHIVHLASADVLPMLQEAQNNGVPISVETTFHYLYFNSEEIQKIEESHDDHDNSDSEQDPSKSNFPKPTFFKCCPPIRDSHNQDLLWDGLKAGTISCVVSDHSPCPPEMKELISCNYMKAWGGISSLQLGLSICGPKARRGGQLLQTSLDGRLRILLS
eukprot:TRINITY_DN1997_c0_g1_i2.p1 TRINITY_DN1997_c0_g1~~TRINITY_DN1997_c0_g1_i2.p1  ORF type:complete len:400 (+),score=48.93 TRINITY_DN1997_c0_g1_i2:95-1294(+)